jgi:hypothetical protein
VAIKGCTRCGHPGLEDHECVPTQEYLDKMKEALEVATEDTRCDKCGGLIVKGAIIDCPIFPKNE